MSQPLTVTASQTLFEAGTLGYHTFRIPAVVVLGDGVVLVAAEGRRHALRDWGEIDLVVRRSNDGGHTFEPLRRLYTEPGFTCGNPTWVYDERHKVLALLFCKNAADGHEVLVFEGQAQRTVWICLSHDLGQSFSHPQEITQQVKPDNFTWYATGPGHGLTLANGRWIVPCCHAVGVTKTHDDPVHSHLIVSDDLGLTWRMGATVDVPRSSECGVVEVRPNEIYVDFRNDAVPHTRGGALSRDAGDSFAWAALHDNVADPGCRGGVTGSTLLGEVWISHARGPKRRDLVLEHSRDGGMKFTQRLVLASGCAAYSDLVNLESGNLGCAFETGANTPYERIDWLQVSS